MPKLKQAMEKKRNYFKLEPFVKLSKYANRMILHMVFIMESFLWMKKILFLIVHITICVKNWNLENSNGFLPNNLIFLYKRDSFMESLFFANYNMIFFHIMYEILIIGGK